MSTYRAKKRGSLLIDGVYVPFDKGVNVTPLVDQIDQKVIKSLIASHIWEDVTVEIKEAQKQMDAQLKKVASARKAKDKK